MVGSKLCGDTIHQIKSSDNILSARDYKNKTGLCFFLYCQHFIFLLFKYRQYYTNT